MKKETFFISALVLLIAFFCCKKEYSIETVKALPCRFVIKDKGIYIMAGGESRPYFYFNNHFVLVELPIYDQFNVGDTIHF